MQLKYVKHQKVLLKNHPEIGEKWVQAKISEEPSILGLGDLIVRDVERMHPGAGRLDLLLQDADTNHRYEVELQLGRTDESHIIRTIEYWDVERKRFPQYEHTAVLIAEDITSRFLNVVSLFNGFIPLIAIQMNAIQVEDALTLTFTTVLSELRLGPAEEDEEAQVATDRTYWEERGSKQTMEIADELLAMLNELDPALELKYNKFYIGLARDGQANNFVVFKPKKTWLRLEPRLKRDEQLQQLLEEQGLDVMDYDARDNRYRIRLARNDLRKHRDFLQQLLRQAHEEAQ
jgi:predicted transport protein